MPTGRIRASCAALESPAISFATQCASLCRLDCENRRENKEHADVSTVTTYDQKKQRNVTSSRRASHKRSQSTTSPADWLADKSTDHTNPPTPKPPSPSASSVPLALYFRPQAVNVVAFRGAGKSASSSPKIALDCSSRSFLHPSCWTLQAF